MTARDKNVSVPQLTDAMLALKSDVMKSINCVKIGRITAFNPAKKTATVQILFRRALPGGTIADYPVLVDCPVVTPQGGGGALQFPIATGDQCLLLFCDRNIDTWFQTGNSAPPPTPRIHDIADGFALVGVNSTASDLPTYPTAKATFFYDGAEVTLTGGLVQIKNVTTSLLVLLEGLIDVLAALTVQGPTVFPLTAASIAALNAYKLQLETLLL